MASKKKRLSAIQKLLSSQRIVDQETLVTLLKERHEIATTQSVVSRDLKELGVTRSRAQDTLVYQLPQQDGTREILQYGILDIVHNESVIVVHTIGAFAPFVADYVDHTLTHLTLGSIAGENTVLVVPKALSQINSTVSQLKKMLHFVEGNNNE